jgi:hypothetical protein
MRSIHKLRLLLWLLCTVTVIAGCKTTGLSREQQLGQFKKMHWLAGKWKNTSPEMTVAESWVLVNDTLLRGTSAMVLSGDTIFSENILLKPSGKNIYFLVSSESYGKTSAFSYLLTKNTGKIMVFEDPKNTAQSKITYTRRSKDELQLRVEGLDGNTPTVESYRMLRMSR